MTSILSYVVVRRWSRPSGPLAAAVLRLLECAGLAAFFYLLNLATGFLAVAALRRVTGEFVSAYVVGDGTLLVLSALQAVVLQWWRAEG